MTAAGYSWLGDLPLPIGSPDLRMGVHPLQVADWLPIDENTHRELGLRRQLMVDEHEFVQMQPGHESALDELISLMEIHIGDRMVSDGSPIERIAQSVADDVVLMHRNPAAGPGEWRLVGGALLFPNQWRLADKMGGSVTEIHQPVDGYDDLLARRVRQFFDRLSPARPVWRRNWFIHDDPTLFAPDRMTQRPIEDPDEVEKLWIRSEWQTLRKLAFSDVIVFTIKTQVAPFSALRTLPEVADRLATFVEQASPLSLRNKTAAGRERAIVEYLRRP